MSQGGSGTLLDGEIAAALREGDQMGGFRIGCFRQRPDLVGRREIVVGMRGSARNPHCVRYPVNFDHAQVPMIRLMNMDALIPCCTLSFEPSVSIQCYLEYLMGQPQASVMQSRGSMTSSHAAARA